MTLKTAPDLDERYVVPGLLRGLEVLRTFTHQRREQTVADIAREASLTRSTAFRLVYTLEAAGFLQKSPNSRHYQLGSQVLDLGHAYLSGLDLIEIANPILKALRDETQTSTHLAIREGRDVVYVARFQGNTSLISTIKVGSRLPVHATAPGRILLTGLTLTEIAALYENAELEAFTETTPTSVGALIAQVEQDRARTSIVSWGSFAPEIASIAAPVYGMDDRVQAALTVSCPLNTYSKSEFETVVRLKVEAAAMQLSQALGYRP